MEAKKIESFQAGGVVGRAQCQGEHLEVEN